MENNFILVNTKTGSLVLRSCFDGKIIDPPKELFQMGNDEAVKYLATMKRKFPNDTYCIINIKTQKKCAVVTKEVLVDEV